MNITVKKFLFVGSMDDKAAFFHRAQQAGIIHFIDPHPVSMKDIPQDVQQLTKAIKVLRGLPPVEQEENFSLLNEDEIVQEINDFHDLNEKLLEEMRVLRLEISRVSVFGDFSLADLEYVEKEARRKIQFFFAKPTAFEETPEPEEAIYIGSEHNLDYYMTINPHPVNYDKMVEIKIEQPLGVLQERYAIAEQEHTRVERELKNYAKFNHFLHHALIAKLNRYNLYTAQNYIQNTLDGSLFAIEGWVADTRLDELDRLLDQSHIYADEIAIEPTDVVPTYLENEGFKRMGEDLVHIYDTPSPGDKDPSLWVLLGFTMFFAFIVGDAGYGAVYLAIALFLRYKFPNLTGLKKRILNIFTVLSAACIIWGVLMTSFFGMQISPDNPLRKLSLIQWLAEKKAAYHMTQQDSTYQGWLQKYPGIADIQDPHELVMYRPFDATPGKAPEILGSVANNIMFELALFIGVVHLILSLLRYSGRNWNNLGWVAFLIGAYLYFAAHLGVPSILNFVGGIDLVEGGRVGFGLMIGGILFAWIGSIIRNGWTGIFELMSLIQVFADVLSYLRLYALALAGAIVASTVNDIASGIPFLLGAVLVVISHAVNIVLGTMSGVIHGLRLNFLEWYHYSFEGGGKRFQPLELIKKD